jgi:site-specific recombinase XerD
MDWKIGRKRVQQPMGTVHWQVAQLRARQLESEGYAGDAVPLTIEQATERFLADATARGLRASSLYKYRLLIKQLLEFSQKQEYVFLTELGTDELRSFRETWPNKNQAAYKKLAHLKSFFTFCQDAGWIRLNPAKLIKAGKIEAVQVDFFSPAQMKAILAACDTHPDPARAIQLRALVLLMVNSGLRIGDACCLARDRVTPDGVLSLYTSKSGSQVTLPLRPEALRSLEKIPLDGPFFFWTGKSARRTAAGIWAQTFQGLFERAEIPGGHSHQFRHTFVHGLLQAGVSMLNVSILLGHSSVKITEKYYAKWSPERQIALDKAVKKAWKR